MRLQGLRGLDQRDGARHLAERARDPRGAELRAVHVALHFAQRERPLAPARPSAWNTASGELFQPCCVGPAGARPRLDETIAVDVAVHVDPAQRLA